jgi:hypothetical protein
MCLQVLPPAEKKVVYKTVAALEGNGLEEEQVTALLAVLGQNQDEKTVLEIQTHTWHPDPKRQATQLKLVAQRLLGKQVLMLTTAVACPVPQRCAYWPYLHGMASLHSAPQFMLCPAKLSVRILPSSHKSPFERSH